MDFKDAKYILITDVGSTTTKGLLIGKGKEGLHFLEEIEIPTTVEKPMEDVKIGVFEVLKILGKNTGVKLLDEKDRITVPYLTTSSAGGGLQILVFGLASVETGRAAEMTAYGAGGVILKTLTIDDGISVVGKMRLIRELHPDMVLMAGGIDGGAIAGVVRLAELLTLARPEPKFRLSERIPLVFCGNTDARKFVTQVLEDTFDVHIVDNIRPDTTHLNTEPAKVKVHQLFMENVMERAPGYAELKNWVSADIIPTPVGVEKILKLYGEELGQNVLMVDMGGATTDIFSNIAGDYYRTVAANIGMSYSISNIVKEVGIQRIMRHLPVDFPEVEVRDYIAQKTLNPTYVPQSDPERLLEQATAIEGIAAAWKQHMDMNFKIARLGLLDKLKQRTEYNKFEDIFYHASDKLFQLSDIDLIIGAGGIISHTKSRDEAFWILVEGFKPRGITRLAVDRNFKSPHMGVLAEVEPDTALTLFKEECLEEIGYVVTPTGEIEPHKKILTVKDSLRDKNYEIKGGEFLYLKEGGNLGIELHGKVCLSRNKDSFRLETSLPVLFDCRGREEQTVRQTKMQDIPLSRAEIPEFTFQVKEFRTLIQSPLPQIERGEYEFERKLPYEGEIFVKPGAQVNPEEVVGENRFGPPKLYIIDLNRIAGYSRPLSEKEVNEGLLVKTGDRVQLGQALFKVKPESGLKLPYNYDSPVRAEVSRIEPQGLIIMREIQDYDGKPHVVDAARMLQVKPGQIKSYLKFKVGDFIERDRILGQHLTPDVTAVAKSPFTGTLKEIDTRKGTITIQYDIKPVPLKSFVKGTITEVKENLGIRIRGKGTILYGIIGFGGEASGKLAFVNASSGMDSSYRGKIAVALEPVDEGFLRNAVEVEAAGIIAPSVRNADWVRFYGSELGVALTGDEDIPFTLILTEGFGRFNMNEKYRDFLNEAEGGLASISGRTQIRAGVTRPMIIISQ